MGFAFWEILGPVLSWFKTAGTLAPPSRFEHLFLIERAIASLNYFFSNFNLPATCGMSLRHTTAGEFYDDLRLAGTLAPPF
jgi:hypothetical protein